MSLSDSGFVAGNIPAGQTQLVVQIPTGTQTPNYTATLKSAAGNRAIELCTDGAGIEFFAPDYDANTATMLVLVTLGPVTHVRFTGAAGDTFRVQA